MRGYRILGWAAYLASFLLVLFPLVDSAVAIGPPEVATPIWRFGALGLLSRAVMTPALGFILAIGTAAFFDHIRMVRVISVLSVVAAAGLCAALAMLLSDAMTARALLQPGAVLAFNVAASVAASKYGLGIVYFSLLAFGGWKAARHLDG